MTLLRDVALYMMLCLFWPIFFIDAVIALYCARRDLRRYVESHEEIMAGPAILPVRVGGEPQRTIEMTREEVLAIRGDYEARLADYAKEIQGARVCLAETACLPVVLAQHMLALRNKEIS